MYNQEQIYGEIFNLSDKNCSISDCIKNNWWIIETYDEQYAEEFLSFKTYNNSEDDILSSSTHNELVLNSFIKKVGAPDEIYQHIAPLRL